MTPVFEGAPAVPKRRGTDLSPCFENGFIQFADYTVRAGKAPAALVYGACWVQASQHGAIGNAAIKTSGTSVRNVMFALADGRLSALAESVFLRCHTCCLTGSAASVSPSRGPDTAVTGFV